MNIAAQLALFALGLVSSIYAEAFPRTYHCVCGEWFQPEGTQGHEDTRPPPRLLQFDIGCQAAPTAGLCAYRCGNLGYETTVPSQRICLPGEPLVATKPQKPQKLQNGQLYVDKRGCRYVLAALDEEKPALLPLKGNGVASQCKK